MTPAERAAVEAMAREIALDLDGDTINAPRIAAIIAKHLRPPAQPASAGERVMRDEWDETDTFGVVISVFSVLAFVGVGPVIVIGGAYAISGIYKVAGLPLAIAGGFVAAALFTAYLGLLMLGIWEGRKLFQKWRALR